jgi:hypothetical protein
MEADGLFRMLIERLGESLAPQLSQLAAAYKRDFDECYERTVEFVLEHGGKGEKVGSNTGDFRVMCPLCGQGSSSGYAEGFKYPLGLWKHLGWRPAHLKGKEEAHASSGQNGC